MKNKIQTILKNRIYLDAENSNKLLAIIIRTCFLMMITSVYIELNSASFEDEQTDLEKPTKEKLDLELIFGYESVFSQFANTPIPKVLNVDNYKYRNFKRKVLLDGEYFSRSLPIGIEEGVYISQFPGFLECHGGDFMQNAVDLLCTKKVDVYSVLSGRITEIGIDGMYGKYIIVESSEMYNIPESYLLYSHLDEISYIKGQVVLEGMVLGSCGKKIKSKSKLNNKHLHIGHIRVPSLKIGVQFDEDIRPFQEISSNHGVSILKIVDFKKYPLAPSFVSDGFIDVEDLFSKVYGGIHPYKF